MLGIIIAYLTGAVTMLVALSAVSAYGEDDDDEN
jgi:hypothetical protein